MRRDRPLICISSLTNRAMPSIGLLLSKTHLGILNVARSTLFDQRFSFLSSFFYCFLCCCKSGANAATDAQPIDVACKLMWVLAMCFTCFQITLFYVCGCCCCCYFGCLFWSVLRVTNVSPARLDWSSDMRR